MNYLDMRPSVVLLPESQRERDRELERKRQIREARLARRADRPWLLVRLTARMRHPRQPEPRRALVEGC